MEKENISSDESSQSSSFSESSTDIEINKVLYEILF